MPRAVPQIKKRAAAEVFAEEPEAKRVKEFLKLQNISKSAYHPVVEAVQHPFSSLPETTRHMLLASLPWSLCVAADERHQFQVAVVQMAEDVINGIQACLQRGVEDEDAKLVEQEARVAELQARVSQAEALQAEALCLVEQCEGRLAEACASEQGKRDTLGHAEAEAVASQKELQEKRSQRLELEETLSNSFRRLRDGDRQDTEVEGLLEVVSAAAERCSLEVSLLAAMPISLRKRERGTFAAMVVAELETGLCRKIAVLSAEEQEAAVASAQWADRVQAGCAELDAALTKKAQTAHELGTTREASDAAASQLEAAKEEAVKVEADMSSVMTSRTSEQSKLELFRAYNVSMFSLLRNRKTDQDQGQVASAGGA